MTANVVENKTNGMRVYLALDNATAAAIDAGTKRVEDCVPIGVMAVSTLGRAEWVWRGDRFHELTEAGLRAFESRAVELSRIHDRADRDAAIDAKDGRI